MTMNVGSVDRILRIIIGVALIAYAIWGTGSYTWLGWIGVVPLVTAFIGTCPAYSLIGFSSKKS